ncbi:MAG: hypothetical protein PHR24_03260 [Oscillospiraceae bacterium]|nr:hypothetical protein [Desulfitobacteriaceae bacterium]MDD3833267.1 hypothetical protein [Oscillospiraceae bacterium]MDD4546294.1 hypothetical protein [Oscillospiraceae bacterium]
MKREQLLDAISFIDDDLIANAQTVKRNKRLISKKVFTLIAACFVIAIAIPYFMLIYGANHKDPSWPLTNKQMYSVEEAKEYCPNLLYEKLSYKNTKEVSFLLNFDEGGINDNSHYNRLNCYIRYNDKENNDKISLKIFFPNNKEEITDWYEYKGTQRNINGVTVAYSDMSDVEGYSEIKYSGCAKFDYNGNTYVLDAFSDKRENVLFYYLEMLIPLK